MNPTIEYPKQSFVHTCKHVCLTHQKKLKLNSKTEGEKGCMHRYQPCCVSDQCINPPVRVTINYIKIYTATTSQNLGIQQQQQQQQQQRKNNKLLGKIPGISG